MQGDPQEERRQSKDSVVVGCIGTVVDDGVVAVAVVLAVVVVVVVVAVVAVVVAGAVVVDIVWQIVVLRDASAVGIERCLDRCVELRLLSVRSRFAWTTTMLHVVTCCHETTFSHACETTTICGGRRAGVAWREVVTRSSAAEWKRVCLFSSWRGVREFASARRLAFSALHSQPSQHESRCAQRRVVV